MDEPTLSFNQAALKIQWSQVLIDNLNFQCNSFIKDKPYRVIDEADPESGRYIFKVGLDREIPPAIPLLMGDVCGNLRASLDYAWMGVIRSENGADSGKVTLPIASNRKGLVSTIGQAKIKVSVKQVEVLLLDRIKSHRDFENGGNKSICDLNDLSNWQKHNLMLVAAGVTRVPRLSIGSNFMGPVNVHGGVCSLVSYSPSYGKLTYDGEPTVEILFGGQDPVQDEPVIPTLVNLAQATAEALEAFCEAFPDPRNPAFRH